MPFGWVREGTLIEENRDLKGRLALADESLKLLQETMRKQERRLRDKCRRYRAKWKEAERLAATRVPPARIEPAPPDVEQRVHDELSESTRERLSQELLSRAKAQGIALSDEDARDHAAWMIAYAEQNEPSPL